MTRLGLLAKIGGLGNWETTKDKKKFLGYWPLKYNTSNNLQTYSSTALHKHLLTPSGPTQASDSLGTLTSLILFAINCHS